LFKSARLATSDDPAHTAASSSAGPQNQPGLMVSSCIPANGLHYIDTERFTLMTLLVALATESIRPSGEDDGSGKSKKRKYKGEVEGAAEDESADSDGLWRVFNPQPRDRETERRGSGEGAVLTGESGAGGNQPLSSGRDELRQGDVDAGGEVDDGELDMDQSGMSRKALEDDRGTTLAMVSRVVHNRKKPISSLFSFFLATDRYRGRRG